MNDHVEVLKYARRLIASGQRGLICHALSDAVLNLKFEGRYAAVLDLGEIVRDRLRPFGTLETWLVHQAQGDIREVPIALRLLKLREVPITLRLLKLRETRLAWIDSLIEEFSDLDTTRLIGKEYAFKDLPPAKGYCGLAGKPGGLS